MCTVGNPRSQATHTQTTQSKSIRNRHQGSPKQAKVEPEEESKLDIAKMTVLFGVVLLHWLHSFKFFLDQAFSRDYNYKLYFWYLVCNMYIVYILHPVIVSSKYNSIWSCIPTIVFCGYVVTHVASSGWTKNAVHNTQDR
ncbi:unnamed protein product, partial [Choristocarpus tenellus]